MNPKVDEFLEKGCGRCEHYDTPKCRVHPFRSELELLRKLVLETELVEDVKWSMPCYTWKNNNVAMILAFRDYCAISFFKGSLLKDTHAILTAHGENSQAARTIRFTTVDQIHAIESVIKDYIHEAIELEKSGQKVQFKKASEQKIPPEFETTLAERPDVKEAFYALTPGRQRAYLLFFEGAKQSKTRESRIEKCIPQILEGKGLND